MSRSMAKTDKKVELFLEGDAGKNVSETCRSMLAQHYDELPQQIAKEIYQEAFALTFKGDWTAAEEASRCAANLLYGSEHWGIEAENFRSKIF